MVGTMLSILGIGGSGMVWTILLVRNGYYNFGAVTGAVSLTVVVVTIIASFCLAFPVFAAGIAAVFTVAYRKKLPVWAARLRWGASALRIMLQEWRAPRDTSADTIFEHASTASNDVPLEVLPQAMVCMSCRKDICGVADLVRDRLGHTNETKSIWYPSEMDLLTEEEVPTYGGMSDPTGQVESYVVRVRCSTAVLSRMVRAAGENGTSTAPTALNSWFPPFKWSTVYCRRCNPDGRDPAGSKGHLGWLFTPPPMMTSSAEAAQPSQPQPFLGLKVTQLRERHLAGAYASSVQYGL